VLDGANVTYTIVVTNSGPSTATGVMATNALPSGFLPVTITPATTNVATNADVTVIWNVGTMTNGSSDTLTLVAAADLPESGLPSSFLDQVFVGSQVIDPAKLNNYAAIKTEVDPAMLTLVATGDPSYMILWPAVAGNLVLEGTVTLAGPWKPIANPAAVGGIYSYVLPGTNGYHFFRLVSQLP